MNVLSNSAQCQQILAGSWRNAMSLHCLSLKKKKIEGGC